MRGQRIAFPGETMKNLPCGFIKKPPWSRPGVALQALEGPALQPGVIVMKAFAIEGNVRGLPEWRTAGSERKLSD
jgi:hypothetical protein